MSQTVLNKVVLCNESIGVIRYSGLITELNDPGWLVFLINRTLIIQNISSLLFFLKKYGMVLNGRTRLVASMMDKLKAKDIFKPSELKFRLTFVKF